MRTAASLGANNWNGGEIYGPPDKNSLQLLNTYFTKYPEDADKIVLSIKGGINSEFKPDGSRAGIQRSIDNCLKLLDGKKFLDLFECARKDPNVPIEETIGYIAEYVKAGKLGGISLSEVGPETIRKAHSVHPISAVEVEFSLWSTEILENGVASTCAELGIPIVAYSPLGRGFLVRFHCKIYVKTKLTAHHRRENTRSIAILNRTRCFTTIHDSSPMYLTKTSGCCTRLKI
jgi:pyridoxine 4-dehydrogenase